MPAKGRRAPSLIICRIKAEYVSDSGVDNSITIVKTVVAIHNCECYHNTVYICRASIIRLFNYSE